jgi:hypothetical protein
VQGSVRDILLKSVDLPPENSRPACVNSSVDTANDISSLPVVDCSAAKVCVSASFMWHLNQNHHNLIEQGFFK